MQPIQKTGLKKFHNPVPEQRAGHFRFVLEYKVTSLLNKNDQITPIQEWYAWRPS